MDSRYGLREPAAAEAAPCEPGNPGVREANSCMIVGDENGELGNRRVHVVRPGHTYVGQQGFTYKAGASAETVGSTQICLNVLPMSPGTRAKVHFHQGIETIAYLIDGECAVYYGDAVERRVELRQGDQIFVPANVPHAPANESDAPCTWAVVHGSGSDQTGIVLLPALDGVLERLNAARYSI